MSGKTIQQSRELVDRARGTAKAIAEETSRPTVSSPDETQTKPVSSGGRPLQYEVPKVEVVSRLGVSVGALVAAEQHVAAVQEFPDLASFSQAKAIATAKRWRTAGVDASRRREPTREERQKRVYDRLHRMFVAMYGFVDSKPEALLEFVEPFHWKLGVMYEGDPEFADRFAVWLKEYATCLRARRDGTTSRSTGPKATLKRVK